VTGTSERSQKLQASILYLGPERTDAASSRGRRQHVGIVESFHVFYKTFRSWVQDWVQSEKGNVLTARP
jgi:uridine phosphorylase